MNSFIGVCAGRQQTDVCMQQQTGVCMQQPPLSHVDQPITYLEFIEGTHDITGKAICLRGLRVFTAFQRLWD